MRTIKSNLLGWFSIVALIALSISAWFVAYKNEIIFAYNDAMSHINIARLVVDNQEPGLSQLGSVWLPLNHVLPLVFVGNDWAWRTGLAASVFSMAAYVVAVVAVYKTIKLLTKNKVASFVGALAIATNLNLLYLQTTPLTEGLFVGLFALSVYIFALWFTKPENSKYLLVLGILGFLQVMTRYDGWFIVAVQAAVIGIHELVRTKKLSEAFGKVFFYSIPVAFAVGLWVLWNALIFNDPLFFAYGQYSSHAQEQLIEQNNSLLSKGDIVHSVMTYVYTMIHNVGEWILSFAVLGLVAFFSFLKNSIGFGKKLLFVLVIASPIIFNIISMYLGFSTIQIPEFYGDAVTNIPAQWFNLRFGVIALPCIAILLGMLANWQRLVPVLCILVIVLQNILIYQSGIITLVDGTKGSSSFQYHGVSNVLAVLAINDRTVLMSMARFNPVAHRSHIELKQVIHEGVSKKWDSALKNPQDYADLIVMGEGINSHDPVRQALFKSDILSEHYEKVYSDKEASIYRKKDIEHQTISFTPITDL